MDELDRSIITQLLDDGRKPFTEIAHTLGVSEGTIRNRVARLIEGRAFQIVGAVDPALVGIEAPAMIGITVNPPQLESAAAEIVRFPEVSYLIMVSGEFDLILEVMCRDREHLVAFLNQDLRQVDGIIRTQTFLILHTYKMSLGSKPSLVFQDSRLEVEEPDRKSA